jgi:hypothetical protein
VDFLDSEPLDDGLLAPRATIALHPAFGPGGLSPLTTPCVDPQVIEDYLTSLTPESSPTHKPKASPSPMYFGHKWPAKIKRVKTAV